MDQMVKINAEGARYVIGSQSEHALIPITSLLYVLVAIAWTLTAGAVL